MKPTDLREHFFRLIQERSSKPLWTPRKKARVAKVPKSIENILQTLSPEKQNELKALLGLSGKE